MVETIQQAGRSQHAGDGDWYALLGYGGSRSAGIVLRFLTSLRYVRNDKKRESRGFAARKSVPKCSILFRFVCGPRTVRNEIGALLKHKWTRMNRFWDDLVQVYGRCRALPGAAVRGADAGGWVRSWGYSSTGVRGNQGRIRIFGIRGCSGLWRGCSSWGNFSGLGGPPSQSSPVRRGKR